MTMILAQIKFEAIPPEDVGGVAGLAKADVLRHILGFCHNLFSPIASMAMFLKLLDFQSRNLSKNVYLCTRLIHGYQVMAKST